MGSKGRVVRWPLIALCYVLLAPCVVVALIGVGLASVGFTAGLWLMEVFDA